MRMDGLCPHCMLDASMAATDAGATESRHEYPRHVSHYQLLGEIARGGNGVVHRAWQAELKREVALKMLLPARRGQPDALARFRREAELMAQLDDPGILPVYEVGEHGGLPYFSMKLAEGGNLAERVPALRGDFAGIARLLARVARTVARAHASGVLHRDLKPSNIVFDADGAPLVTDFGLARHLGTDSSLTGVDALIGTPRYVAPEVVTSAGAALTPAVDVYGLGAILYELLTGIAPFAELTPLQVLREVAARAPLPPRQHDAKVPPALEAICLRCLEKRPRDRYASANKLAQTLEAFVAEVPRRRMRWWPALPSRRRRAAIATVLLSGTVAIAFGAWWFGHEPIPIPDPAIAMRTAFVIPDLYRRSDVATAAARRLAAQLQLTPPLALLPFEATLAKAMSLPPADSRADVDAVLGGFIAIVVAQQDGHKLTVQAVDNLREERLYEAVYAPGDELRIAHELAAAVQARRAQPVAEAHLPHSTLAGILRARRLLQPPQPAENERAIAALKAAIAQAPDSALAHATLAAAYAAHGGETFWLDSAIDEAARAQRLDPTLGMAPIQLGWIYYRKMWPQRAITAFEQAQRLGSQDVAEALSLLYTETGRFADAYGLCTQALRFGPDNVPRETAAHILFTVGAPDAGERILRVGMTQDARARDVALREAEIAQYRRDYARCHTLAAALDPQTSDNRISANTLVRQCAAQQGDFAAALATIPAFRRDDADSGSPSHNPPAVAEAILLAQMRQGERLPAVLAEARQTLQAAVDSGNEMPKTWLRLAAVQRLSGETDAAYATLERAFAFGMTWNERTRAMLEFLPFANDARFAPLREKSEKYVAAQREAILHQFDPVELETLPSADSL
jgi:tetratricopeptide (TPR) repeat protein